MSESLAPGVLIAVPPLLDPNCRQSVVLRCARRMGPWAGIVNHESPLLLTDLCDDQEIPYMRATRRRVRRGGPVQQPSRARARGRAFRPRGPSGARRAPVSASKGTLSRLCSLAGGRFRASRDMRAGDPRQLEQRSRRRLDHIACRAGRVLDTERRPDLQRACSRWASTGRARALGGSEA